MNSRFVNAEGRGTLTRFRQPVMPSEMTGQPVPRGMPADRPMTMNNGDIPENQQYLMELSKL